MDRGWFSRNWWWITVIGVVVIAIAVIFGLEVGVPTAITFLLGIAAIFFASRSLKVTQDSLELTRATTELARATTRPFLTYLVDKLISDKNNKVSLRITVSNTGNLPAEKPQFQVCQVTLRSTTGEPLIDTDKLRKLLPEPGELKKRLKDERKETAATYFPGEKRNFTFTFGPNMLQEYQESKCLAMGIIIFYKSMQREYETVRWFLHDKRKPPQLQFAPIPEKDYFK